MIQKSVYKLILCIWNLKDVYNGNAVFSLVPPHTRSFFMSHSQRMNYDFIDLQIFLLVELVAKLPASSKAFVRAKIRFSKSGNNAS